MRKLTVLSFVLFALCGCTQRGCQSFHREFSVSERNYEVTVYSGGKAVFHDKFHGIINQEEHSDGIFYYKGDTLKEVGGDYLITSTK